jgi:hypothetical protein
MEALSRMLSVEINDGLLEGFKVGNVIVSHLLFADDTLIFCNASPNQLAHLRGIFLLFFFFFFDKSKYYIKKHRGAQPLVHWEYKKGTREREKKRKENLQS